MFKRESIGKKWRRKLLKFGKWLGITVFGALLAGYSYMRYDFVTRADRLDDQIAIAQSFGLPLDPKAFDRYERVPIEQNAALKYEAISPKMKALRDERSGFIEPDIALMFADAESRAIFAPMLARIRPINAELRAASALPDMAMKKDWDDTWNVWFPEFADLKGGSKWLCVEAIDAARRGEWDLANRNLEAVGKIAYHSGRDKVFIGGLVQVAIGAIGLNLAARLAEIGSDDPVQLARLRKTVAAFPEAPPFERYLEGETFFGYWTMSRLHNNVDMMAGNFTADAPPSLISRWAIMPPFIEPELVENANAAQTLTYWNDVFRMIREDKTPAVQLGKRMDRLAQGLDENLKPWMKWSSIMLPVFSQGGIAFARHDANKACTLALIDAMQFKAKNGRWPRSLQESGSKATDPYGDGKLRMLVKGESIRIYSVGPDLKDEGGMSRSEFYLANKQGTYDDQVVGFPEASMRGRYNLDEAKKRLFEQMARNKQKTSTAATKVVAPPVGRLIQ